jgi:hypothetical protein
MTEQEWLACTEPGIMLQFLRSKASDRKLRLFACASARGIWRFFPGERTRSVVAVSEKYADGLVTKADLKAARKEASRCEYFTAHANALDAAIETAFSAAEDAKHLALEMPVERAIIDGYPTDTPAGVKIAKEVRFHQCAFIRDIFTPFRPTTVDPSWLTSTVTSLAQAIYTDRSFDRLPILATS